MLQEESNIQLYWQAREYKIIFRCCRYILFEQTLYLENRCLNSIKELLALAGSRIKIGKG
jgi:hypothetical protein